MMNNHKLGDATTNNFSKEENWCLGEKEFGALGRESNVFSEFRNDTTGRGFKKLFIADEVYRIVKPALKGVREIKVRNVAKQATDIISDIMDSIINLQSWNVDILSRIPPLHAVALEDNSFLIEWIFSKYRIGFVLERNKRESMWYLVSTIEENVLASGMLSRTDYKKLLAGLISFVFGYA